MSDLPMPWIVLKLDPLRLANADLDIRYLLPDRLVELSEGAVTNRGYEYAGEHPDMYLFLTAADVPGTLAAILSIVENERILGNDLRSAVEVGVEEGSLFRQVYPSEGPFEIPSEIGDLPPA